jgi:5-methyltetrahydrofolate corrinoid/iron sulfur protein methyltransferase
MAKGIDSSKIFFDPLVLPVGAAQEQAVQVLDTLRMLKESFDPPVKTVVGLSNISNGAPKELRPLINRVFGVLAYGAGLDAAIIDAKDKELVRIFKMLEREVPENEIDELYLKLVREENPPGSTAAYHPPLARGAADVLKTAEILLNKKIYSPSFLQV